MPYLWSLNENQDWTPLQLTDRTVELAGNRLVVDLNYVNPRDGGFSGKYVLLWRPGQSVRVNGLPLHAGIHVLADRDEIRVNTELPVFFSEEVLLADEVYEAPRATDTAPTTNAPGDTGTDGTVDEAEDTGGAPAEAAEDAEAADRPGADAPSCPRCEKPLEDGDRVVRCPACSLAYHYSSDDQARDCWRYAPQCTCGHSTEMGTGFQWTPHGAWE
jgi:hypothetical protein